MLPPSRAQSATTWPPVRVADAHVDVVLSPERAVAGGGGSELASRRRAGRARRRRSPGGIGAGQPSREPGEPASTAARPSPSPCGTTEPARRGGRAGRDGRRRPAFPCRVLRRRGREVRARRPANLQVRVVQVVTARAAGSPSGGPRTGGPGHRVRRERAWRLPWRKDVPASCVSTEVVAWRLARVAGASCTAIGLPRIPVADCSGCLLRVRSFMCRTVC